MELSFLYLHLMPIFQVLEVMRKLLLIGLCLLLEILLQLLQCLSLLTGRLRRLCLCLFLKFSH